MSGRNKRFFYVLRMLSGRKNRFLLCPQDDVPKISSISVHLHGFRQWSSLLTCKEKKNMHCPWCNSQANPNHHKTETTSNVHNSSITNHDGTCFVTIRRNCNETTTTETIRWIPTCACVPPPIVCAPSPVFEEPPSPEAPGTPETTTIQEDKFLEDAQALFR